MVATDMGRAVEARPRNNTAVNSLFTGNNGTGTTTTLARIFGDILSGLKIRPSDTFLESSGQKLLQ